jgi:TATA-box binding protein (TBP) (component of TFIID and TFIIIB)
MNINKYMSGIQNNPYYSELKNDIIQNIHENTKNLFSNNILTSLNDDYNNWLKEIPYCDQERLVNVCSSKEDICKMAEYIMNKVELNNETAWNNFISLINKNWKDDRETKFNPTELKYVTSTAICYITIQDDNEYKYHPNNALLINDDKSFELQFQKIFDDFIPPPLDAFNVLSSTYSDEWVNKIVGCINHKAETRGFSHVKANRNNSNSKHFQNSVSFIVSIDKSKDINIKIFINGKLQLTGVPIESDGIRAVNILCDYLYNKYHIKMEIKNYSTVMINTCYDLCFNINREVLYDILIDRYNLITVFDTEGYPGVRIHYFYNDNTKMSDNEGQCVCPELCDGDGDGTEIGKCKRISIAIFQSGKVIIAGGCSNIEPIRNAYRFINEIIKDIQLEIEKEMTNQVVAPRVHRKRRQVKLTKIKLDSDNIENKQLYRTMCLLCSSFK